MANKKIKRLFTASLIIWTLVGYYFVELFETRDLWEYISLFLFGSYIYLHLKTPFKHLYLFLLVWNVADEAFLLIGNDTTIQLLKLLVGMIGTYFVGITGISLVRKWCDDFKFFILDNT